MNTRSDSHLRTSLVDGDVTAARGDEMLASIIAARVEDNGGWLGFDAFMRAALYEPGLGYYSGHARKFGRLAGDGSDFVTAPELSPLFGRTLARQAAAVMAMSSPAVLEFGAGSGRLAADLLLALGDACHAYSIVEVSGALRETQRATLAEAAPQHLNKVRWLDAWPVAFSGFVVGNEVLDAMPVRLLERGDAGSWLERGVVCPDASRPLSFAFATLPADAALHATIEQRLADLGPLPVGYQTEIAEEAPAFVASLADVLVRGAAVFIDYGFPAAEYYHPQRAGGTLMCHEGHLADHDPLIHVGVKDITAHVDFTAVALAGQDAGMDVAGYTSQARFLLNCGMLELLESADWKTRASAQTLIVEHEMGELFKVLAFTKGLTPAESAAGLMGFVAGDRSHTL
jgi:SAM-dependent MidA family methyltransferase